MRTDVYAFHNCMSAFISESYREKHEWAPRTRRGAHSFRLHVAEIQAVSGANGVVAMVASHAATSSTKRCSTAEQCKHTKAQRCELTTGQRQCRVSRHSASRGRGRISGLTCERRLRSSLNTPRRGVARVVVLICKWRCSLSGSRKNQGSAEAGGDCSGLLHSVRASSSLVNPGTDEARCIPNPKPGAPVLRAMVSVRCGRGTPYVPLHCPY